MIHSRPDYNRIQDPALGCPNLCAPGTWPIKADEPVILFRGQDKHFGAILAFYAELVANDSGVSDEQKEAIRAQLAEHGERAFAWQEANFSKSPDVPL